MTMEDIKMKVEDLRMKALAGTMSFDEVKAAVAFCREHRLKSGSSRPSTAAKSSKPSLVGVPKLSADDLLGGL